MMLNVVGDGSEVWEFCSMINTLWLFYFPCPLNLEVVTYGGAPAMDKRLSSSTMQNIYSKFGKTIGKWETFLNCGIHCYWTLHPHIDYPLGRPSVVCLWF